MCHRLIIFRVLSLLPISVLLIILASPQKDVQVQATTQIYSLLGVLLYINPKPITQHKYQSIFPPHS